MARNPTYRILWPRLGWRPLTPGTEPAFNQGKVAILVVAPWCPDCQELAPKAMKKAPKGAALWLAGEFAPAEEIERFARENGITWPILTGTSEKNETSRVLARFREIRHAFGDKRNWGVPTWIEGEIRNGWLEVRSLRDA